MKKIISIFLGVLSMISTVAVFSACGGNTATPDEATTDATAVTDVAVATYEVSTRYGQVKYPEQWKEKAEIKTSDKKIEVALKTQQSGNQKVFDICFGGKEGDLVGKLNNGKTEVHVITYEPSKDSKLTKQENTDFYVMMEDLNYILQSLNDNCGMEYVTADK